MRSNSGGFYSALDADSVKPGTRDEHAEGAYYLWPAKEIENTLNKREWLLWQQVYNINKNGNIQSDPFGEKDKLNILYTDADAPDLTVQQQKILQVATSVSHQYVHAALATH